MTVPLAFGLAGSIRKATSALGKNQLDAVAVMKPVASILKHWK